MLALLLLFHNVAGKDTHKDVPTIQNITSCPDIGYYFKRDVIPNSIDPGPCNLCFCQDNTTSVCWPRESERCDPKGYTFNDRRKRADRNRRSPGFADIFFRDAAREVFDRQTPEQCKPYESSISEGCPPADWCIGCTVCDCDANGRWDCHTLSFCDDKKGKKQVKRKRISNRNRIVKRQTKKKTTPKTTKKPNKKPEKKFNKKPVIAKKPQIKKKQPKQNKNKVNKKGKPKKIAAVKKSKKPFEKKKVPPKMKGSNKNVKKGKKAITIQSKKGQRKGGKPLEQHETVKYAKMILKKVMDSVDKVVNNSKNKVTKKRSMTKNINKNNNKNNKNNKNNNKNKNKNKKNQRKGGKKITKWQPVLNKSKSNRKQRRSRRKRQITKDNGDHMEKENITSFLPKIDDIVFSPSKYNNESLKNERSTSNTSNSNKYFEYNVDSKYENNTVDNNKTEKQYTKSQMLVKNNDLETIHDNNVTLTESTVFKSRHNGTEVTPVINFLLNANLIKKSINIMNYKQNKTCGRIGQWYKSFKMMNEGNDKIIAMKKKDNAKNKNLMSYFRNVFRRLFQVNKKKEPIIKKPVYRKRNIVKNLCKNINPCNFDPYDKTLQSKLYQLKKESHKILKSVKIIKGLLKLFGDKKNSVIRNNSMIDNNQQNRDIFILNAILKDRHNLASTFTNLTETQLKQVDYIKDNTKMFVQSIENFALIINDITKLLRKDNKQRISRRTLRCTKNHQTESIQNSTVGEKIKKIKNLLISYNLVQNRFMKGMFDVLSTLDQKTKPDITKLAKVSDEIAKSNESLIIDNYTKNIINNLRKLKSLAEKLSFKNRIKRAAMGKDSLDYFLMLIEYLLKRNSVSDVPPASDGIDLLIEAIQNSPDIKIQKTVLDSVPLHSVKTDKISSDSLLLPPYHSKDKINKTNITLKSNKVISVFESIDDESKDANMDDDTDKYYNTDKDKKTDSEKEKTTRSDDKSTINNEDLTTSIPRVYIAKDDEKMNGILGTFDNEKNDDKRGYEVFVDDTDEDDIILITSTPSSEVATDIPVNQNIPKRTTLPPNTNGNILKNAWNTIKAIKKTNLDWVEDNLSHEENRRDLLDIKETTTQIAAQRATRTVRKPASRYFNPVSSISRETEDERQGKTMNPEYLMHKKQMNLLNSLDYGTEKSVLDSDSKEEKYNSESFPFM